MLRLLCSKKSSKFHDVDLKDFRETHGEVADQFSDGKADFVLRNPSYRVTYEHDMDNFLHHVFWLEYMSALMALSCPLLTQKRMNMCPARKSSYWSATRKRSVCRNKGQISTLIQKVKYVQRGGCMKWSQLHFTKHQHQIPIRDTHV